MAETLFESTSPRLGQLLADIERGRLALPELQRPFVWQKAAVRDLLDSMYRGFPVGYLMLWNTSDVDLGAGEVAAAFVLAGENGATPILVEPMRCGGLQALRAVGLHRLAPRLRGFARWCGVHGERTNVDLCRVPTRTPRSTPFFTTSPARTGARATSAASRRASSGAACPQRRS